MLNQLSIKNFLTIETLSLPLEGGFTAFTGETGAGKSVLMEAISLAFGKRGGSDLVRPPAQEAHISLVFTLPIHHPFLAFLDDQGFRGDISEEDPLIIKRIITTDGKSRCFINDIPTTLAVLKECGKSLIEIHGQFDRLLDKQEHRSFLDAYGNLSSLLTEVESAYRLWQETTQNHQETLAELETLQKENIYFSEHLEELIEFSPQENEEDLLLQKRLTAQNQKKVEVLLQELDTFFEGNDSLDNHIYLLERGFSRLESLSPDFAMPQEPLNALTSTWMDLKAAYASKRQSLGSITSNLMEEVDERLHLLRSLARKHQTHPNSLAFLLTSFEEKKKRIHELQNTQKDLHQKCLDLKLAYEKQASLLSKGRTHIAEKLETAVLVHLKKLKLERLLFQVCINLLPETSWSALGQESIEFLVSANGDTALGSFKDHLSGGELSRVLLALKAELAESSCLETIIFDEIDSAMSGSVASHIGKTLTNLSQKLQVLVITHTPHVASCAQHHIRIDKIFNEERALTHATHLEPNQRIEEMARMLSGTEITPQALEQARHFLESNLSLMNDDDRNAPREKRA